MNSQPEQRRFFGIHDYWPGWTSSVSQLIEDVSSMAHGFVGHRIRRVWTLWDDDGGWCSDGPVIVDAGRNRLELCANKMEDFAVTVNMIDPTKPVPWPRDDDFNETGYSWTDRAHSCLVGLAGKTIRSFHVLEYRIDPSLEPIARQEIVPVGVAMDLGDDWFEVSNGLDCNQLSRTRCQDKGHAYIEVEARRNV